MDPTVGLDAVKRRNQFLNYANSSLVAIPTEPSGLSAEIQQGLCNTVRALNHVGYYVAQK